MQEEKMSPAITERRAMQIGPIARRTGVNIETIRYYERIGILPKPLRSEGGHRIYTKAQENRLSFIRRSRELGFSIEDVRALLGLAEGDNQNCADVYGLAVQHLDAVKQKIADLKRMERVLKSMAAECAQGTLLHCPIIEALSATARP
jgi:MerR family mercuric resistance operon transcriptional regulator